MGRQRCLPVGLRRCLPAGLRRCLPAGLRRGLPAGCGGASQWAAEGPPAATPIWTTPGRNGIISRAGAESDDEMSREAVGTRFLPERGPQGSDWTTPG